MNSVCAETVSVCRLEPLSSDLYLSVSLVPSKCWPKDSDVVHLLLLRRIMIYSVAGQDSTVQCIAVRCDGGQQLGWFVAILARHPETA